MCGICGTLQHDSSPIDPTLMQRMTDALTHRGPDGMGVYQAGSVALGMRRLSVIDVHGSHQPLYNEDKSIALVFNGEIYNYHALRHDLEQRGHRLTTDGDGETIAHLLETYDLAGFDYLRGMFAVAVWDARQQRLILARDPLGEKPLFYYRDAHRLVFASELKALFQHPHVPRRARFDSDPHALAQWLAVGYMNAPETAFEGIYALPPAHVLVAQGGEVTVTPYWHAPTPAPAAPNARMEDYLLELRERLALAVQRCLLSDVPLGAFLSGGLDSSLIVALMRAYTNAPVKTFSIGFEGDSSFDETAHAQAVAQHLHTEHTTFRVAPDALALLPKLVYHHDQPFSDSSAIPTYLVSQLTRQHVTVALTGDGGDELFAGYERFWAAELTQRLRVLPAPIWKGAHVLLERLPEGTSYYNPIKRVRRFVRGASLPLGEAYFDFVRLFNSAWIYDLTQQPNGVRPPWGAPLTSLPDVLRANMTTYLPDDLLVKTDRASMMASLEARAPFLDRDLVEFVATIPYNLKMAQGESKRILKALAHGLLPENIINRKKHGFGVPLGAWLRRDTQLVRETLLSHQARQRGIVNPRALERLIAQHAHGTHDHAQRLWALLTLEWWYRLFVDTPRVTAP